MKTLKFVMFLFYRYYSQGGTKSIPYFSALCAVVFLIYIHVFQALILLDGINLLPLKSTDLRIEKYGKLALFLLPIFLIIAYLVKPKDLINSNYDERKIKRGSIYLLLYVVASIILLFTLMILYSK